VYSSSIDYSSGSSSSYISSFTAITEAAVFVFLKPLLGGADKAYAAGLAIYLSK